MKKFSNLLLIVASTIVMSFGARAQVLNSDIPLPENEIGEIIDNPIISQVQNPLKSEALKRAKKIENAGDMLLVYADYKYDKYGKLIQKSKYTYDETGRNTETITYILNDNSQNWMYGREKWLISLKLNRSYTKTGFSLSYENYNLDIATGILIGSQKYKYDRFEIENFNNKYESYSWDYTNNEWKGSSKYVNTNILSGNIINSERINYTWDATTKSWNENLTTKTSYKYQLENNYWFTIEIKSYSLTNGSYICTSETTYLPNVELKTNQSSIQKSLVNGELVNAYRNIYSFNFIKKSSQTEVFKWVNNQWENYDRTLYSYNSNGNNVLTEAFRWDANQWKLTTQEAYEYTLPDSTQTRTVIRTQAYYQLNNTATPSLCVGQTMFPYRKYINRVHPKSRVNDISYTYQWDNAICAWKPYSSKNIRNYDVDGKKLLSSIVCNSYNTTEWLNCQESTYTYNLKNRRTSGISTLVGNNTLSKYENIYNVSDTVLLKTKYYVNEDLNWDGIISSNEWAYDGELVYNYNPPFTGDSAHVTTSSYGDLEMYDLSNLKKLKVSGPLSCDDLSQISQLSRDSLQLADLSDATLSGDSLKRDCLGSIRLQTLILPKTLKVIDEEAIESSPYEDKYLINLVVNPLVQEIHPLGILVGKVDNVTIPSKFFKNLFESGELMNIPGYKDIFKSSLKTITFNDISGKIEAAVCYNMPYLQKATILDGATEIGNNAFKSCGMLREVNFPASLQKIGYNAFWGCNELTSLTLPEGLNTIDYSAFWGCSGVTSISMPSSLYNIAQNAFWGCSAVSSLKVAAQAPPSLGNNALQGVPRDASVEVPETGFTAYKAAPQWKEFFNMKTSLQSAEASDIVIASSNGKLVLQHLPLNASLRIYTVTGAKILDISSAGENETIALSKGVYVLQINNQRFKTIIQ